VTGWGCLRVPITDVSGTPVLLARVCRSLKS